MNNRVHIIDIEAILPSRRAGLDLSDQGNGKEEISDHPGVEGRLVHFVDRVFPALSTK